MTMSSFLSRRSAVLLAAVFSCSAVVSFAVDKEKEEPVRCWDFTASKLDKKGIPDGWSYRGKPGTPDPKYELVQDKTLNKQVLRITSDKASGVIMVDTSKIDLEKYPVLRWRWKAVTLPDGADAAIKAKDDQGLSIYVGYGKISQESISYNWQTETPKGKSGKSTYNHLVDVDWFTLRDKNDKRGEWFTEEVNVRDDMKKIFGKIPSSWALSVSSNSQYTASKADVYLDFIEFAEKKTGPEKDKKDDAKPAVQKK